MAFTPIPGAGVSISVTDSTGSGDLGTLGPEVTVSNVGDNDCYLEFGASTVTATTADWCLPSGQTFVVSRDPSTQPYVAAICASGETTTLKACAGFGN